MSPLGGDVDIPQRSERVGDDLILDPPDSRVTHLLCMFAAISHRGWTASPVVVELGQRYVHKVPLARSQTGEGVVVENNLGPLGAVE